MDIPVSSAVALGNSSVITYVISVPVVGHASCLGSNPSRSSIGTVYSQFGTGTKPRSTGHHRGSVSGSQCSRPGSTSRYSLLV